MECAIHLIALTLSAAAILGQVAAPPADQPQQQPAAAVAPLRVDAMSFNIRYGTAADGENHWRHRREFCIDVIDRRGGDFVGLQEALRFQIDEIRERLPRYGETGVGRDDGQSKGEHSTVLYDARRWRLDAERHGTFWLSDTPDEPGSKSWGNTITRIVTFARFIEIESGRAVWVFNTHFDHRSQSSRERSAMLLAQRVAARTPADGPDGPREPVIVMGDLNAGEDNPAVRYLKGERTIDEAASPVALIDTFRAAHPDAAEVGTFTAFELGRTDGPKIDFILVEQGATVHEAAIIREQREGRYPSDHFPVTATVSW